MSDVNLWVASGLVALGIIFHFVTKLYELEQAGQVVAPWVYWRAHPYASLLVVMGAYLLMAVTYYIGELTNVAAILIGIAANSAGDKLRARAEK